MGLLRLRVKAGGDAVCQALPVGCAMIPMRRMGPEVTSEGGLLGPEFSSSWMSIYVFGSMGSCLCHVESSVFIVECELLVAACGI